MKPTTDAGRRAAEATRGLADYYNTQPLRHARLIDAIDPVAIEQEARAQGALHEHLACEDDIERAVTRVLDALAERAHRAFTYQDWHALARQIDDLIEQHRPKGGPG